MAVSSPLRWAGSKKRIIPVILRYCPQEYSAYLEPFAGSAALFFSLATKKAALNDTNPDLIDFYKQFRQTPDSIISKLRKFRRSRACYNRLRQQYRDETDPVSKSAIFLYLNRNCFNGIYRTNTAGNFNVPFSNSRVAKYPRKVELIKASQKLKQTKLKCMDFETFLLSNAQKNDFAYLDPPYYVPDVRTFREYGTRVFENNDFKRLTKTLRHLDRIGCKFMLSYPDCELVRSLAKKWTSVEIDVRRSIASSTTARKSCTEILVRNYESE